MLAPIAYFRLTPKNIVRTGTSRMPPPRPRIAPTPPATISVAASARMNKPRSRLIVRCGGTGECRDGTRQDTASRTRSIAATGAALKFRGGPMGPGRPRIVCQGARLAALRAGTLASARGNAARLDDRDRRPGRPPLRVLRPAWRVLSHPRRLELRPHGGCLPAPRLRPRLPRRHRRHAPPRPRLRRGDPRP